MDGSYTLRVRKQNSYRLLFFHDTLAFHSPLFSVYNLPRPPLSYHVSLAKWSIYILGLNSGSVFDGVDVVLCYIDVAARGRNDEDPAFTVAIKIGGCQSAANAHKDGSRMTAFDTGLGNLDTQALTLSTSDEFGIPAAGGVYRFATLGNAQNSERVVGRDERVLGIMTV
ncbi:uncharacterized protein SPSK_11042 [Sporothrix schenckii 1099-18]|uniref:Uncharacterized protein n=1 Tax=Sporothrix schenckii 1099-18 TaxID=1397361 RepID=A0A0F2MNA0_SPOSC|nr:uncharacterized protein SPSK_11042 [Sporothrix schenckii 1099-18]KJR89656.1 hypothetical protein SPSK_11042 [Sporothrix schenckii 1099-18]